MLRAWGADLHWQRQEELKGWAGEARHLPNDRFKRKKAVLYRNLAYHKRERQ